MGQVDVRVNTVAENSALSTQALHWQRVLQLEGKLCPMSDVVTYNACLNALDKGSHWKEALVTLRDMSAAGLSCDEFSLSSIVSACGGSWHWLFATELLVVAAWRHVQSTFACNAAQSACERARQWWRSLAMMQELAIIRVSDVVTCNSAVTACQEAAMWQISLYLLQTSDAADAITFSSAVTACCEVARWQNAIGLLETVRTKSFDVNAVMFAELARACAFGFEWQVTLSLMAEMRMARYTPDSLVLASAANALEKVDVKKQPLLLHFFQTIDVQSTVSLGALRENHSAGHWFQVADATSVTSAGFDACGQGLVVDQDLP